MEQSRELYQLIFVICAVTVAMSAVLSVWLLRLVLTEVRYALRPTPEDRASRLQSQAKANRALLETSQGRRGLVEFFVSEANISAFLREAEEKVQEVNSDQELEQLLSNLGDIDKKKPWYSFDRIKKGAQYIGDKLFDKANDLVKPYIGGSAEK